MSDREHIHVVPNPAHRSEETRDLVKTVAITSAVSSIVGVFAIAGGQALWALLRRAIQGPKKNPVQSQQEEQRRRPEAPPEHHDYTEDDFPDALKYNPRLRNTGPKRRKPQPGLTLEDMQRMFSEFEGRIEERLSNTERRVDSMYEEEDDDAEDAA